MAMPSHEPGPGAARVLIIDQDHRVRRDLAALVGLDARLRVVGAAGDPATAIELAAIERPDIVLVDPRLPDVDAGFALIALLRRHRPAARIVVMSHAGELEDRALERGADAFIAKSGGPARLLDEIAGAECEPLR